MEGLPVVFVVTIGHSHDHGLRPLLSNFVAHLDLSVGAITAAGNCCPASSDLRAWVEGAETAHWTDLPTALVPHSGSLVGVETSRLLSNHEL